MHNSQNIDFLPESGREVGSFSELRTPVKTGGQARVSNSASWTTAYRLAAASVVKNVFAPIMSLPTKVIVAQPFGFLSSVENMESETNARQELYDGHRQFGDFHNCGEEQETTALLRGRLNVNGTPCECCYYVFSYIKAAYVPTNDAIERVEGKLRHRCGIVIPGGFARNIAVTSSRDSFGYPHRWVAEVKEFNELFSVHAEDENIAAQFLNHDVTTAFIEIVRHFRDLNVEMNKRGELNISFSDRLDGNGEKIISRPEIKKRKKLLDFIRILRKQKLS